MMVEVQEWRMPDPPAPPNPKCARCGHGQLQHGGWNNQGMCAPCAYGQVSCDGFCEGIDPTAVIKGSRLTYLVVDDPYAATRQTTPEEREQVLKWYANRFAHAVDNTDTTAINEARAQRGLPPLEDE